MTGVKEDWPRGSDGNGEIQCSTQCTHSSLIYRHMMKTGNSRLVITSFLKVGPHDDISLVAILAPLIVGIVEFLGKSDVRDHNDI